MSQQTSQPDSHSQASSEPVDAKASADATASPATTPKKRGRPRKQPLPEGAEAPPKRKRGRPRKSETDAAKAAASPASAGSEGDTPKKKRGRPKKDPNADSGPPKKRGRPRKVPTEGGAEAKPADSTPKKRGRPRKNPVPVVPGAAPAATAGAAGTSNAPAATTTAVAETKESDAVPSEPRLESRKRKNVPAESDTSSSSRKRAKTEDAQQEIKLDFEHLDRSSLQELQQYARQHGINMRLHGETKADYMHAISLHQLNNWELNKLKAEVAKRGIDMDDYGSTTKRKMDYIHAIIDHRMGKDGEPLWTLWKEIYLVGTEWENYDSVFDVDWDFNHLKEALEEGGYLYAAGEKHPVYLFGVTERTYRTVHALS